MLIYFLILISKIIENSLSTLRLIIVSNGKKKLGAILQGMVTLVWIFSLSITIIDINKNVIKIVFFILGSMIGSYLGSVIEEKIALGNNILICVINKTYEKEINARLHNYKVTTICEKDNTNLIVLIFLKRKEINKISTIIKNIDKNSMLISEKAKALNT